MGKKNRRSDNFYRGTSSIGHALDALDPLHSKENAPPSDAQLEVAQKIGADLTGKNAGLARHAIAKKFRDNAIAFIDEHGLVAEMTCLYNKVTLVTITKIGGAPNMHAERGAVIYISAKGPPLINKWVHPRWLSDFKMPPQKGEKKVDEEG